LTTIGSELCCLPAQAIGACAGLLQSVTQWLARQPAARTYGMHNHVTSTYQKHATRCTPPPPPSPAHHSCSAAAAARAQPLRARVDARRVHRCLAQLQPQRGHTRLDKALKCWPNLALQDARLNAAVRRGLCFFEARRVRGDRAAGRCTLQVCAQARAWAHAVMCAREPPQHMNMNMNMDMDNAQNTQETPAPCAAGGAQRALLCRC
jgi:hypothetical protein